MNYADFVESKFKSGQVIQSELLPEDAHRMHAALGVAGEIGELVAAIMAQDRANIVEELGDLEFYLTGIDKDLWIEPVISDLPTGHETMAGLIISMGDLVDEIKRQSVHRNREGDHIERLLLASGRVRACLAHVYQQQCVHIGDAREANMDKLDKRYAQGYSDKAAVERADKQ